MLFALRLNILTGGLVLFFLLGSSVTHASGETMPDTAALTSVELVRALKGESVGYRGQIRDGDAAIAFAEGYIYALADESSQRGLWCGFAQIAPHELLARAFDGLRASVNMAAVRTSSGVEAGGKQKTPAAKQVVELLQTRFPCPGTTQ